MVENHSLVGPHEHTFGQDQKQPGERRTLLVLIITATMMVVEIGAGIVFGSMALLADGMHMASHATALGINFFAYMYARRHARSKRFCYGTGKVNALGGFTGALLLVVFALLMAWQSIGRFMNPVTIAFNQAIMVAVLGLIINGASVLILGVHHHDSDKHDEESDAHHHDYNLRSAYLHVLADALTSILAILALLLGKYAGLVWMDPLMGIFGAILVSRWSWDLLRNTSRILLDHQGPESIREKILDCIQQDKESRVTDLHIWEISPGIFAATISVTTYGQKSPDDYKCLVPSNLRLGHVIIEVNRSCR